MLLEHGRTDPAKRTDNDGAGVPTGTLDHVSMSTWNRCASLASIIAK